MAKPTRQLGNNYGGMEGAVTDAGYDSYATAWRYLGTYTDGTTTSSRSKWSKWKSSSTAGTRKLLWAAYKNPNYAGYQIGEVSRVK
jgi:hypothetical protein